MKRTLTQEIPIPALLVIILCTCIVAVYPFYTFVTSAYATTNTPTVTTNEERATRTERRDRLSTLRPLTRLATTTTSHPTNPTPTPAPTTPTTGNNSGTSSSTKPTPKPTTPVNQNSTTKTMAWIYPGSPACNAVAELEDGRQVDTVKAEFFSIVGGKLITLTSGCNAFSATTVSALKENSTEQYVTISSADPAGMETFLASAIANPAGDITKLVTFVTENDLTGIELDFEGYADWTAAGYKNYKTFVTLLGNALHAKGKKLMLDGPAVSNATEEAEWYLWRYSDFTSLPVDHMVVMAYDYQYDYGAGTPVAPLDWIQKVITFVSSKYPKEKLTIGLPSYGYEGTVNQYDIKILTREQMSKLPGYSNATRDAASGEMTWRANGKAYFYQDATSLRLKRDAIAKQGITSVSVWHLGGNPWF